MAYTGSGGGGGIFQVSPTLTNIKPGKDVVVYITFTPPKGRQGIDIMMIMMFMLVFSC